MLLFILKKNNLKNFQKTLAITLTCCYNELNKTKIAETKVKKGVSPPEVFNENVK